MLGYLNLLNQETAEARADRITAAATRANRDPYGAFNRRVDDVRAIVNVGGPVAGAAAAQEPVDNAERANRYR